MPLIRQATPRESNRGGKMGAGSTPAIAVAGCCGGLNDSGIYPHRRHMSMDAGRKRPG
ncbi:MAG: hypothetical protein JXB10_08595 [Pirellulales bacterium]|nr:hypothetical protein [Pirellulales bacterium]